MKKTIIINKNDAGQRIDKFLTKSFPNLPQSELYKAIRKKDIKINGKRCDIKDKLNENDEVYLFLHDDFLQQKPKEYDFLKAPKTLNIVYEDENIMLLDKKPGLIVHPDENYHYDSLIARVHHYLYDKKEYDPEDELSFTPALVNRIDRNTGGIVMAAKNAEALRIMNQKVKDREINKFYLCVTCGKVKKKFDVLTGYLEKNESQNRVYISEKKKEGAKTIITKYNAIKTSNKYSLLEVELLTGRTHQIRAHLASIGHPLAGDGKYGTNKENKKTGFPYQALYSYKLQFEFKTDGGILNYLDGKEYSVNPDNIWFIKEFDSLG